MNRQVDAWIDALDEDRKKIAEELREIILEHIYGVEERFSFKLPFYHYYGMFCYINKVKKGIELCFCRGKDLLIAYPELELKNRSMIAGITFSGIQPFNKQEITQLISGAAAWNKEARQSKKGFLTKKK